MSSPADDHRKRFMTLYEPVHERLSRFIQTLVWNREEAKDIMSETILRGYEKWHTLRDQEKFVYFLFSIAANLVRSRGRRSKFVADIPDLTQLSISSSENAEASLIRKELYELLNRLNPKQREAIVLFELNGFSIKEIAKVQGLSESGVKSNLVRARVKLSAMVKEADPNAVHLAISQIEKGEGHGK